MNKEAIAKICSMTDHTNLKKDAVLDDIKALCADADKYGAASVCVYPYYVEAAHEFLKNSSTKVCTVVGFPNGMSTTYAKVSETTEALSAGAKEIDMVINIAALKNGEIDYVRNEIWVLSTLCHHQGAVLKVIIETCLLTKEEITQMCQICIEGNADYIKTSTGFDKAGAQIEDIKLMKETINGRDLKIKASGGIRTLEDAQAMIDAGADRIGASAVINEAKKA